MTHKVLILFSLIIAFNVVMSSPKRGCSDNLNKLAIANNYLGLNLYHLLVKGSSGNVFFSPLSISTAFGILYAGAKGNTAKQLRCALGYNAAKLKSSEVPLAFNRFLNIVIPQNQSPNPEYILYLANELLLAENFNVNPDYKNQVQNLFRAYIEEVDFENNSAQIVEQINNFVEKETHEKIKQLISELSKSTLFFIVNAIYFKGSWKTQFETENTKSENFYNDGSNSKAKKVPLMHLTSKFPYASDGDLQAVELPYKGYKGDNVSMIVILPKERGGLDRLEKSITPEKIQEIQKQMYATEVTVTLPKFSIEYQRTLNSDFKALGATAMFNSGSADFSGITPQKGVYVSEVVHKAVVVVNEEGSEAAAVTGVGATATAVIEPQEFTADHPFIFAIMENQYKFILFMGRVNEL
ncbi:intracellular coagulation inhibitor 1-like [Parasteatoda tepidariorum]|uniref:intracellular coagulation inhibitor 1-like n=1 Tax=Parasteatoda tepidariorum TaxID=114398 RepID=UPI0039BC8AA0